MMSGFGRGHGEGQADGFHGASVVIKAAVTTRSDQRSYCRNEAGSRPGTRPVLVRKHDHLEAAWRARVPGVAFVVAPGGKKDRQCTVYGSRSWLSLR